MNDFDCRHHDTLAVVEEEPGMTPLAGSDAVDQARMLVVVQEGAREAGGASPLAVTEEGAARLAGAAQEEARPRSDWLCSGEC